MDERPRINPKRTATDRLLELGSVGLGLAALVYAVVSYRTLPATVPTHFNLRGQPDGYGSSGMVVLLGAVAMGVQAMLAGVGRIRPWHWNIPVRVTQENATRVYGLTRRFLGVIALETGALMLVLEVLIVGAARTGEGIGVWPVPVMVGTILATSILFVVVLVRGARAR